jgi:hypothetical protein
MNIVWRIWCEYDFNQDQYVFSTKEASIDWLSERLAEDGSFTFDEIYNEGLVSFEALKVL